MGRKLAPADRIRSGGSSTRSSNGRDEGRRLESSERFGVTRVEQMQEAPFADQREICAGHRMPPMGSQRLTIGAATALRYGMEHAV